jgi:hypothetical protein
MAAAANNSFDHRREEPSKFSSTYSVDQGLNPTQPAALNSKNMSLEVTG